MIEQKIAKIVAIASGVKPCEEERETDLCQINTTLACNRCLTAQLEALIEQEQKPMRAMAGLLKDSAEHSVNAYTKKTKQQIAKQCSKCPHWEGFCMVKKCILEPEPAEMPLISEPRTNSEDYDEGIRHGSRYQRDVDMAWLPTHDQQVASKAVKEFVEKVREWKQVIADSYKSPMPVDRVQDMLDDLIASVLEGK